MFSRARMAAVGVLALLLSGSFVLSSVSAQAEPQAEAPRSTIDNDFREDPHFSAEQKKLLQALAERSTEPLRAESWSHGRTVGRLELAVPSELPAEASLAEHAVAFVERNLLLWRLDSARQLRVTAVREAGDCSTVTLQLVGPDKLPVFNAVIGVVVSPDGIIRAVAGHVTGDPVGEPQGARIDAEAAAKVLRTHLKDRGGHESAEGTLPEPTEMILDPFYLTDGAHQATRSWVFDGADDGGEPKRTRAVSTVEVTTNAAPVVHVVDQSAGAVTVTGPSISLPGQEVAGCGQANPVRWLGEVVVDPMTGTPAYVGLGHLNVKTTGSTATERAYDVLSKPFMLDLYGDRAVRRHLRDAREIAGVGGRTRVRFQEYYGGLPVEGAGLTVTLLPNGNAESVSGRFVYFPHVNTVPDISEREALATAYEEYLRIVCGSDDKCRRAAADEYANATVTARPVILSAEIFQGTRVPTGEERLAYRMEFPRRVVFWDADHGGALWGYPTVDHAIPHTIRNRAAGNRVEIVNGTPAAGITPHADSTAVSAALGAVDAYYLGLGRNGFDDQGGSVDVAVRAGVDNAFWCRTGFLDQCGTRMLFGTNLTADDVVGHEFTHGVVEFTADFVGGGEPGALNEHYSDVLANVIFPDARAGEWKLAEESPMGAVRDMANPGAFGDPGHYALLTHNCADPEYCVHSWAGVPNRAAVLIADGGVPGSAHPGVGRDTLGQLYFTTLSTGGMGSSDLFLHERVNTIASCRQLVQLGQPIGGRTPTLADCDHVARAFDTVGVTATTEIGWTRFSAGLFGGSTEVETRSGLSLHNGCTIANQILRAEDPSGRVRTSDVADGLAIDFVGEWGTYVLARGAASDPRNRAVQYRIWTNWFHAGVVDVDEVFAKPAGLTDDQCRQPAASVHRRTLFSTAQVAHWAVFFNGGSGDDRVNAGLLLPAGCQIESVRGLHYHHGVPEGAPALWLSHQGLHGFRISRPSLDPRALETNVRWWHEGISGIFVRVQYDIFEPAGVNCLTNGLRTTP
ncbi:M4 family metallopeptidase [Micromonospora sp. WMMD1082]|uniref:M4 family metallopeptidase n=1 Tax=Micromonospora sp. WMMD1082 TaxID=3016104 RepID=UPI002416CA68|nr:M4 family metallopeptidase [Micromonospora sp. WMMD1082]MDG4796876.1 M4 family metallopeptidase [Micromonospora sp. WMMD1082]